MTPVIALLAVFALCRGFNLEPRHAVVLHHPKADNESYFGYALAFWRQSSHGQNTTWLLVGAPQAQEEGLKGDRVRKPGAVFKFNLSDVDNAQGHKIYILGEEDRIEQDLSWRRKVMNIPKRAWIGATIAVENEANGAVVVCAPRMKEMLLYDIWYIPGMCFYWKTEDKVLPLAPLRTVDRFIKKYRENGFIIGLAQSGISAHFVENSPSSQLIVGAPGVDFFTGTMHVYDQRNRFKDGLTSLHAPILPQKTPTSPEMQPYLGYSVGSIKFYKNKVSFVAGAPRDKGVDYFTGAVYIMSGAHEKRWSLETKLEGQQMGEYFGACVTAVDLNMDGVDELLLVGAPLHSLRQSSTVDQGEQGRLYVYKNMGRSNLEPVSVEMTGSSVPGARFATTISVIGDLNRDGYNDVAVGAPYEGGGAVYIYLGGRDGLSSSYSQRISASDINHDLSGFGFSLSTGLDLDGNSFPDIAIGSYASGNVVIVRSRPVVEMESSLEPVINNLDVKAKTLTITPCLAYTTNAHPDLLPYIDAEVTIKADSALRRAVFESGSHWKKNKIHLQRNMTHCWNEHLSLQRNRGQLIQPVEFSMHYGIAVSNNQREETFCKLCPVTDPAKPSSIHIKVPFSNDCGGKTVCLADLKVKATSSNMGEAIILGKDNKVILTVNVFNLKEPAYLTYMSLPLPKTTRLVKMPKQCYQERSVPSGNPEEDVILCDIGNIFESDVSKIALKARTTIFEIDTSSVDLDTKLLTFNISTWSSSVEETPQDNYVVIDVPVVLVSEVEITGKTMQKLVPISSKDEKLSSIISITHKYQVVNLGPSPVGGVSVSSSVPLGLKISEDFGVNIFGEIVKAQLISRSHTSYCSVDYSSLYGTRNRVSRQKRDTLALEMDETESYLQKSKNIFYLNCSESSVSNAACAMVQCTTGLLNTGDTAELELQININRTIIDLVQQKGIIQISSTGWMKIDKKYVIPSGKRFKHINVATLFVGNLEGTLPLWILILAIIAGIILLSVIIITLHKAGFFRRQYKENMETMIEEEQEYAFEEMLAETGSILIF